VSCRAPRGAAGAPRRVGLVSSDPAAGIIRRAQLRTATFGWQPQPVEPWKLKPEDEGDGLYCLGQRAHCVPTGRSAGRSKHESATPVACGFKTLRGRGDPSPVSLALGVLAALAAAVLYSAGVTLQSLEAREAPAEESLKPSLLKRLVTRPRWLGGTGCVVGGWAMQAAALMLAPITIVQPALAVSVVALLFIGVGFFGEDVRRRELAAALAIVVGVGGLVLASPGQSDTHAQPVPMALGMGALGAVALAPYALRDHGRFGAMVAVSAGLAYAWTGLSTKFLADGMSSGAWLAAVAWLGATLAAAGVGLLSEMTALQSRQPIRVFPVVLVVQIAVAVLLAPLLAGEGWSSDPLVVVGLVISLTVLVAGTRALAGASAVGRAIATEESEGDGAPPAGQARDGDEGREGDRADHEQRQHETETERRFGGDRERRGGRGDEAGRGGRQPDEVLAVVHDREAG